MNIPRRLLLPAAAFALWEIASVTAAFVLTAGAAFWLTAFLLTIFGLTALMVYFSAARLPLSQAATPAGATVDVPNVTPAAAVDATPIADLLREAQARLAQSHLKTSLADLPLYLIAGAAGAGKTSTFLASGLAPELLAGQVKRDATVLPTSWCNLWYASGALFVEAGGRFVSDDASAWRELIRRLGKTAPQVRGVIWFCDVTSFLGMPDPTRLDVQARKVRERLQAVGEILGSSFPVYVVFTKADQIPHCGDFVQRLVENEDQQVLGCTLPAAGLPGEGDVYAEAQTKRLQAPFTRLSASLAERRLSLLARETDASRKPGVYEFPREMKRIRDSLIHFLTDAFRPNPLQPGPLLRGFYFTATREVPAQAGLDPLAAVAERMGGGEATVLFDGSPLAPVAAASPGAAGTITRWIFSTRLFHDVILADPLGKAASAQNVHRDLRRNILLATAAALGLVFAAGFTTSWWQNRALLESLDAAAASSIGLRSTESLRAQLASLRDHERYGAPMSYRWGLYSGTAMLPRAYDAYFARFAQLFFTPTRDALAAQLATLEGRPYNAAYNTLKTYRMVTQGQCKADAAFLVPAFSQTWQGGRAVQPADLALAERQMRFYAAELARKNPYNAQEKPELVARGRQYLAGFGGVDRLYRGVIDDAGRAPRQAARLASLAPNFADVLASPGEVPAAFTREGWAQVERSVREPGRQSLGESCVVGDATAVAAGPEVSAELTAKYTRAYIETWKGFLHNTSVLPFRSAAHGARQLEILGDNRSPLLAALFLVSENTNVGEAAKVFQPSREVSPAASREHIIEDPNRVYANAIGEMQRALARLEADRPGNPDAALHEQARRAAELGLDAVRVMAQRFNIHDSGGVDGEVKRLLESPFRHALRFVVADPSRVGREKAGAAARSLCAQLSALDRRFPFNPASDVEATAQEVANIFAPGTGALANLPQQMARSVTRQGKTWTAAFDADPKPAPDFLEFLNRMSAISDALFTDGQMRFEYSLRARPSPGTESISLEIDGASSLSTAGNNSAKTFTWPGPPGNQQVLVRVKAGANIPFASYDGLWGVFRMMNDADPRPPGSRAVELSKVRRGKGRPEAVLDARDKPIQVRLEFANLPGNVDVFDRSFLKVRCPVKITE